jgi:histidine triad (HIT) family protein
MITHRPLDYVCPFCSVAAGRFEPNVYTHPDDVILHGDAITAFISSHWWPNNPGHVLVIPKVHYENVYDIPDELLHQVQSAGKRIAVAMKAVYRCDGTSFRQHNEPAGNQDVWHYHLHVFPRYTGDDLYLLTPQRRLTHPEERRPYAARLREYFARSMM